MTDSELLLRKVVNSGLKLEYIAKYVGITRQTLSKKIHNRVPFNQYEIAKLCEVLKIESSEERDNIFFAA